MKRMLMLAVLMAVCSGLYAQTLVKEDKGRSATVYKVWVGSVTYNVITADEAGAIADWAIKNLDASKSVWLDFDSTVSTGPARQVASPNGYLLNENGELSAGESFSPEGMSSAPAYINAGDPAGVEVQVYKFRSYQ